MSRVENTTTLLEKNPAKSLAHRVRRQKAVRPAASTKLQAKRVSHAPSAKAAALKKKQALALEMSGETPISDDDFDGAGYNLEGIWDWNTRRFRSPSAEKHGYFEKEGVDLPACSPDGTLPKLTAYIDCGREKGCDTHWTIKWDKRCYKRWYGEWCYHWPYWWRDCWDAELPTSGGAEVPPGDYAVLGADCIDDRPLGVVIERTREHAAIEGGCVLSGCGVEPDSLSALDLPDGISVTLFAEEDFMGNHISFQGPQKVYCMTNPWFNFNDKTRSMKVFLTVGLDAEEPQPPDRIHDSNWIYPGGPDSSGVRHDVYFNQWDDPENMPRGDAEDEELNYHWKPVVDDETFNEGLAEKGPRSLGDLEVWQQDVNNLY